MQDYLIVGLGLAGISFCEVLEKNQKTFTVINNDSQQASQVAGGLYNPVILKRFTLAWKAKEQLTMAFPFYADLEKKLSVTLDSRIPVYRRFASVEEQNLWFEAADRPQLGPYLSTKIVQNINAAIDAPHGYGEVLQTGRVNTKKLIFEYANYLRSKNVLQEEAFDFEALQMKGNAIRYKSLKAKHLVFAMGFGLGKDPYFNYLPLNGTKGELLTVKIPNLRESNIIKSGVFIIPLGNDLYSVGATYKWKDKTNIPTEDAKSELLEKLTSFLKVDYEVVSHVAGIRPTVSDRRPLVGRHPEHQNLYVLNGLGSRGVMIAPYAAKQLYHFIEQGAQLDPEMDIARFTNKHFLPHN